MDLLVFVGLVSLCIAYILHAPRLPGPKANNQNEIDLHEYTTGPSWVPTIPHSLTGAQLPCTLGHEFSGTIIEVGEGVSGFKIGQKAAIEPCISDSTCTECKEGFPVNCGNLGVVGFSGWDGGGGMSEYICLPPKNVHLVPDSMSLEVAALIEPLTVPWRAMKASGFKAGQTALVLGSGLCFLYSARWIF
jgi:threonine dehydrogenase-like Zn-dependent dehydrogenase